MMTAATCKRGSRTLGRTSGYVPRPTVSVVIVRVAPPSTRQRRPVHHASIANWRPWLDGANAAPHHAEAVRGHALPWTRLAPARPLDADLGAAGSAQPEMDPAKLSAGVPTATRQLAPPY